MKTDRRVSVNNAVARISLKLSMVAMTVLMVNGGYLAFISLGEFLFDRSLQDPGYQLMFALHLLVGVGLLAIFVIYVAGHMTSVRLFKNPKARKWGYGLVSVSLVVLISGIFLTRGIDGLSLKDPWLRALVYGLHVALPVLAFGVFRAHLKAGRGFQLEVSAPWIVVVLLLGLGPIVYSAIGAFGKAGFNDTGFTMIEMKKTGAENSDLENIDAYQNYFPSLIKTTRDELIPTVELMRDDYCKQCHQDSHQRWQQSAHHLSSFSNPFYRLAIDNTKTFLQQRDGHTEAARFCAGCHDPVPLLAGEFDRPDFAFPDYPSAGAGITCTVCHSITSIDSPKGNADFTIESPSHYPFAFSKYSALREFSNLLVKSNPDFHKRTFLKPLHKSTEFCGSCHKVHIPEELNHYKWLRGQNHYDAFLQSGVSGHNVNSFYYPKAAQKNCNQCHMPTMESSDFGAKHDAKTGGLVVSDHLFLGANTALPHKLLADHKKETIAAHQAFLKDSVVVDIIGLRKAGQVDGGFVARLDDEMLWVERGERYIVEVVVRTKTLGHNFTNGTTDSNQVWVSLTARAGDQVLFENGVVDEVTKVLPPYTHQVRAFLIDRSGRRIDRRNVEDIYTSVYNHQIPPGAADVVHYAFTVPENVEGEIEIEAKLNYRKFDSQYLTQVENNNASINDLPVTQMSVVKARLHVVSSIDENSSKGSSMASKVDGPEQFPPAQWQRLNDYGIALFRKPERSQFKQAEEIFYQVEALGSAQGALNLVRLFYSEGRLDEAAEKLNQLDRNALDNPWSAEWMSALINFDNGFYDEVIATLTQLKKEQPTSVLSRGFDFSKDYALLMKLGEAYVMRAKLEPATSSLRPALLEKAKAEFQALLMLEPEHVAAHFGMVQVASLLGDEEAALKHRALHAKYKMDDHAREQAVANARAASAELDHAANPVAVYPMFEKRSGSNPSQEVE